MCQVPLSARSSSSAGSSSTVSGLESSGPSWSGIRSRSDVSDFVPVTCLPTQMSCCIELNAASSTFWPLHTMHKPFFSNLGLLRSHRAIDRLLARRPRQRERHPQRRRAARAASRSVPPAATFRTEIFLRFKFGHLERSAMRCKFRSFSSPSIDRGIRLDV